MIRSVRIIAKNKEERDIFLIPPNFLNVGSLFGGMLKLRNTLEAVALVVGVTIPILKITVFSFTAKTILLCLTALPICIFALIGIGGESLTAFLMNFFRFLQNRKMQYRSDAMPEQKKSRRSLWQSEGEWPEEYGEEEKDAVNQLEIAERTARTYLMQCGNNVVEHENPDSFMAEVLYMLLNRKTSTETPFSARAAAEVEKYIAEGDANAIPISAFLLPEQMDFSKAAYCRIDGLYYSYFMIPSTGYKTQVTAGWLSLLINAGEGIDVDLFLSKEPKEKIQFQLDRQIRINRSKMKETSDTNTDFDDIDSAVRAGYYLMTADEVLRMPLDEALIILRGQNVFKVKKFDYTRHPESRKLKKCKAAAYIPDWRKEQAKDNSIVQPSYPVLALKVELEHIRVFIENEMLYQALLLLPKKRLEIIILSFFADMPDKEIGKTILMPKSSVQYNRNVALQYIRKMMEVHTEVNEKQKKPK